MNLLYLCDEYPPGKHGGIGTVVQLLAREMARRGHRVVVAGYYDLGYGGEDRFDDQGVLVYRFRSLLDASWWRNRESLTVRAIHRLVKAIGLRQSEISRSLVRYHAFVESLIRKHDIEIVERPDYNDYLQYCTRSTVMVPLSVPTVMKLHGTITYFLKEANRPVPEAIWEAERETLQQADAIISVSEYTARKTAAYFGYEKPISVLYNGIQTRIDTDGTVKDPNRVVFTGSLQEKKGIYQLMKAWNLVCEWMPQARLEVFGRGALDRVKAVLDVRAADSVHFVGHVSRKELFRHLAEASVAVFPSYAECFAMGPMEAMACGTTVIYTSRSSGLELITHGVDGLVIDPDDVEDLARQIVYVLQHSERNLELARRGRERVTNHFDITFVAQRHEAFYRGLIAGESNDNNMTKHSAVGW
jgi:glycosyltransferase involved in cell wall biosynthesis